MSTTKPDIHAYCASDNGLPTGRPIANTSTTTMTDNNAPLMIIWYIILFQCARARKQIRMHTHIHTTITSATRGNMSFIISAHQSGNKCWIKRHHKGEQLFFSCNRECASKTA